MAKQKKRDRSRKKLMAKPADEILPKTIKVVQRMAAKGMTQEQIADLLGMSISKLHDLFSRHPELSIVYKKARAQTADYVTGKLMKLIRASNVAAILFYLKTQCGWREKIDVGGTIKHDTTESFAKAVQQAPTHVKEAIEKLNSVDRAQLIKQFNSGEAEPRGSA